MTTPPKPSPAPAPRAPSAPRADSPIDDPNVVYISDPRVSVAYGTFVGDYATIADPVEREWLVANGWAYDRTSPSLPAAYHVGNPGEWTGYPPPAPVPAPEPPPEPAPSPEPPPEPAPSPPARRRV